MTLLYLVCGTPRGETTSVMFTRRAVLRAPVGKCVCPSPYTAGGRKTRRRKHGVSLCPWKVRSQESVPFGGGMSAHGGAHEAWCYIVLSISVARRPVAGRIYVCDVAASRGFARPPWKARRHLKGLNRARRMLSGGESLVAVSEPRRASAIYYRPRRCFACIWGSRSFDQSQN